VFGSNWQIMLIEMERLMPQYSCPSNRTRSLSAGKPGEQSSCESSAETLRNFRFADNPPGTEVYSCGKEVHGIQCIDI
jgi:hypothetical protein